MSNKWYEEAVFYHIYPLGLCDCPEVNSYKQKPDSSINQLLLWIDHLLYLGVNAVYLGPLFESESHGYDTVDYYKLDRRLGTNEDFKNLVKTFQDRGIKVVVDGVFNHVSRDFFAFQDIIKHREFSQYRDWFKDVQFGSEIHCNCWRGCNNIPNLNMDNPDVRNYLLDVVKFWVDEFNIDGIRLDVADVLDFRFMRELSVLGKTIKEDFWLMGEVIHGDYNEWVRDDVLHSTTNYEMYKGIYSSFNDVNFFEVAYSLKRQFNKNDGIYKNHHLYNFIDNHDVNRISSTVNKDVYLYNIHTLLYTIPGIPSLYYGSEWMIEGKKENHSDRKLRPSINLYEYIESRSGDLIQHLHNLSVLYKNSAVLKYGSYREVKVDHDLLVFEREYRGERVLICINSREEDIECNLNGYSNSAIDLLNGGEEFNLSAPVKLYPSWARIFQLV